MQAIKRCCPIQDTSANSNQGSENETDCPSTPPHLRFRLVQGPPGTGKTHLICGIISCWLHNNERVTERSSDDSGSDMDEDMHAMYAQIAPIVNGYLLEASKASKENVLKSGIPKRRVLMCAQSNAGACHVICRFLGFSINSLGVSVAQRLKQLPGYLLP